MKAPVSGLDNKSVEDKDCCHIALESIRDTSNKAEIKVENDM